MAAAGGSWKGGVFTPVAGGLRAGSVIQVAGTSYTLTAEDAQRLKAGIARVRSGEITYGEISQFAGGAARQYRDSVREGRSQAVIEHDLSRAAQYRAIANEFDVTPRAPRRRSADLNTSNPPNTMAGGRGYGITSKSARRGRSRR